MSTLVPTSKQTKRDHSLFMRDDMLRLPLFQPTRSDQANACRGCVMKRKHEWKKHEKNTLHSAPCVTHVCLFISCTHSYVGCGALSDCVTFKNIYTKYKVCGVWTCQPLACCLNLASSALWCYEHLYRHIYRQHTFCICFSYWHV